MDNLEFWLDYIQNKSQTKAVAGDEVYHSFATTKEWQPSTFYDNYFYQDPSSVNNAAGKNLVAIPTISSSLDVQRYPCRGSSSAAPPAGNRRQQQVADESGSKKWVFLNYGDETKRVPIPGDLKCTRDVRNLFYNVFSDSADLDRLHDPQAKVYVQDQNRPEIFYELEDLSDIKPKCMLKLHELVKPAFAHPGSLSTNINSVSKSMASLAGQTKQDDLASCASETASEPVYQKKSQIPRYRTLERPCYPAVVQQPSVRTKTMSMDLRLVPTLKADRNCINDAHSTTLAYEKRDQNGSSRLSHHNNYSNYKFEQGAYSPVDRSCLTPSRSGSVTPIIDEEARARVMGMEKQLADLSTLVHLALMPSKGLGDTVHKDLELLRREILGTGAGGGPPSSSSTSSSFAGGGTRTQDDAASDTSSLSRCSDLDSERGTFASLNRDSYNNELQRMYYNNGSNGIKTEHNNRISSGSASSQDLSHYNSLKHLKRKTHDIKGEVKNLRRLVQTNSQTARDVLKDAFDRIKVILNTNQHLHLFAEQARYQNHKGRSETTFYKDDLDKRAIAIQQLEKDLNIFEKRVDETRDSVVSGTKRLKIDEVEAFTNSLTNLIRAAANEKARYPVLQDRLKEMMNLEMERFVKEDKYLKEEPQRLDNALRRCKKLTGTIITMKKLALVQDPKGGKGKTNHQTDNSISKDSSVNDKEVPILKALNSSTAKISSSAEVKETKVNSSPIRKPPGKMLDGLLEQLNNVGSEISNSDTIKRSPKSQQPSPDTPTPGDPKPPSTMSDVKDGDKSRLNGTRRDLPFPASLALNGSGRHVTSVMTSSSFAVTPTRRAASPRSALPVIRTDLSVAPAAVERGVAHNNNANSVLLTNGDDHDVAPLPQPPLRTTSRPPIVGQQKSPVTNEGGLWTKVPAAVHTNAVDVDDLTSSGVVVKNGPAAHHPKSSRNDFPYYTTPAILASSSESINSQETMLLVRNSDLYSKKPPPPPPPPRNRQEMIEYRQHELNSKQLKYQHIDNGGMIRS